MSGHEINNIPSESLQDRMVRIAKELHQLNISEAGVSNLLRYDLDEIENQLTYLPYRKAKRPGAFLIEAVRHRYAPPKEFYYAINQAQALNKHRPVDKSSESVS